MAIDRSAAEAATSSLQSLPFGNIIGGPLVACVEAQAQAARTSWEFIQNVGLYADGEEKKTVNVSFQFIKDGRMAQITVPLLTIVPIPYIAINSIDINFKANISASAASTETEKFLQFRRHQRFRLCKVLLGARQHECQLFQQKGLLCDQGFQIQRGIHHGRSRPCRTGQYACRDGQGAGDAEQ